MDLAYNPPATFRDSIEELHELVAKEVGSEDFGPGDYLAGLKVFLQSMDYDPHFHADGRRAAWGRVVAILKGRAQAIKSMKENPGFDAHPIVSPVIITGIPRSGTTALHRLMAVDPRFQGLQTWLLDSPMPRPPRERWASYPEFQNTAAMLEAHYVAAPGQEAAHFRAAEEVHECCILLSQSFCSNILACSGFSAATYDAWWRSQSEAASYRHYCRCVQLIGSTEPEKRWLLKNPGHIENLDLLFAIYPDARVIQTHRDPAKAIPSLVSLLMNLHPLYEEGRVRQHAENMLVREVYKWAEAVRKAEKLRRDHPGQVLDITHDEFHGAPMDVLERVYAFIDTDIPDETRTRFARRIVERPELARGAHHYNITDYGMTEDEARAPFGDYVQRYELVEKRR